MVTHALHCINIIDSLLFKLISIDHKRYRKKKIYTVSDNPSNSYFFILQVLYIGKIKVWQKKVPETFIDDALEKFKVHELEKNRLRQLSNIGRLQSEDNIVRRGSAVSSPSAIKKFSYELKFSGFLDQRRQPEHLSTVSAPTSALPVRPLEFAHKTPRHKQEAPGGWRR